MRWIVAAGLVLLLLPAVALADAETLQPTSTTVSDTEFDCDPNVHIATDDDVDSPDGCTASTNCCVVSNCTTTGNQTIAVAMADTSSDFTGTQSTRIRARKCTTDTARGQPELSISIEDVDGTECTDVDQALPDDGSWAIIQYDWTHTGCNLVDGIGADGVDVIVRVQCKNAGGAPGNRARCDFDAIDVDATVVGGGGGRRRTSLVAPD